MAEPSLPSIQPVLVLGAYLKEQDALQQRLPRDQRHAVPTYEQLGELAGVAGHSVYRVAQQGYLTQLPLALAYRLMRALRDLGFEIGVQDIITWQVPDGLWHPANREWQGQVEVGEGDRLVVTLGAYLDHLRAHEAERAEELGRPVPGWQALSQAAGASRRQIERILADHVQRLDLPKLAAILGELAQHGWAVEPEDVLLFPEQTRGDQEQTEQAEAPGER